MTLQALSEAKVYTDLFSLTDENEMGHIQLSRAADLLVVAPATANILAKMAGGLADDLASTVLLATDKPVLVAPAMNVRMWLHPATQANMATLKGRGVGCIGPNEGAMACNEFGPGRMAEPEEILAAIEAALSADRPLAGRHAIVTSGPTHEPIDPVRYLANRSSGRQGIPLPLLWQRLAPGSRWSAGRCRSGIPPASRCAGSRVRHRCLPRVRRRCRPMLRCSLPQLPTGVWPIRRREDQEGCCRAVVELIPNPDILATVAAPGPARPRLVVGFAAETDDLMANAQGKLRRKNADWIVANDVSAETGIMGGDENEIHLITAAGVEDWPQAGQTGSRAPPGKTHCGGAAMTVPVRVRRLPHNQDLPLPCYATDGAAGMDLLAAVRRTGDCCILGNVY